MMFRNIMYLKLRFQFYVQLNLADIKGDNAYNFYIIIKLESKLYSTKYLFFLREDFNRTIFCNKKITL